MKKISLLSMFLFGIMSYNSTFAQERVITRGVEVSTNGYMPEVGVMAPDFSATDKGMNEVSLSSFKGKKLMRLLLKIPWCFAFRRICLLLNQDFALRKDWTG